MATGKLFVVSGPSGVGKGTVCKLLLERTDMAFSVSMTNRAPREGEVDGVDYYYVTDEEFDRAIEEGDLLEHVEIYGNKYGTPRGKTLEKLEAGENILLDIETIGAANVKKMYPEAVLIFLMPPSIEALRERILGRKSETEESLKIRLDGAMNEISKADSYDYRVVNDDLDKCVEEIIEIYNNEISK